MNLRYVAVVAAFCSVLTAGCASATAPNPEGRSDGVVADGTAFAPVNHTDGCGVVTFPATGDTGAVFVTGGAMTCDEATSVVDRYLHDPGLVHAGNTWAAQFDGWDCAMPTATAAETYGYSAACRRADGEIQVRPAADTSSNATSARPTRSVVASGFNSAAGRLVIHER
ncbi:hypothetical protein ACN27E_13475 [Mycobacterium sp. WMMD1722]|uniref:hypothetical protein n=1 Tax=Mycobacterium sp. WMMD1722 TaxID=3404117 RepID=UPI003BF614BF